MGAKNTDVVKAVGQVNAIKDKHEKVSLKMKVNHKELETASKRVDKLLKSIASADPATAAAQAKKLIAEQSKQQAIAKKGEKLMAEAIKLSNVLEKETKRLAQTLKKLS